MFAWKKAIFCLSFILCCASCFNVVKSVAVEYCGSNHQMNKQVTWRCIIVCVGNHLRGSNGQLTSSDADSGCLANSSAQWLSDRRRPLSISPEDRVNDGSGDRRRNGHHRGVAVQRQASDEWSEALCRLVALEKNHSSPLKLDWVTACYCRNDAGLMCNWSLMH